MSEEKTTHIFYKWVYRDKNTNELKITLVFYNEDGISPYGLKVSDLGTPIEKIDSLSATLNNWKMKEK